MLQIIHQTQTNLIDLFSIPKVFTPDELNKLQQGIDSLSYYEATTLQIPSTSRDPRRSQIKWINQTPPWHWLYKKLNNLIVTANKETWGFNLDYFSDNIQYTEYNSSYQGHYEWHMDIGPNNPSLRKISISIQLSDPSEYEGGDLEFFTGGDYPENVISIDKKFNTAILFPSYLLHRVTPVTKGIRKSLVIWVGGTQFR